MVAIKPKTPAGGIAEQRYEKKIDKRYSESTPTSFAYASREVLEGSWKNGGQNKPDCNRPFDGPLAKKRKCRDVICLALFGSFLVLMGVVAGYAFVHGSFSRLNADDWDKCGDVVEFLRQSKPSVLTSNLQADAIKTKITPVIAPGLKNTNPIDFFTDAALKFKESWPNIVYMCLIALGLSVLMTGLLRLFAGIIIWMIITVVIVTGTVVSSALWIAYTDNGGAEVESVSRDYKGLILTGAVITSIITALLFLVTLAMKKRIALVAKLFKEAGKALQAVPLVLFQPAWTVLCQITAICIFAILALLIETIRYKDSDEDKCHKPTAVTYLRFLNLFAFLWISQFLVACQHVVVAGAISRWFFTRNKKQLASPLLVSLTNLVRYHLGSVAFGSLVVAIVKFIRFVLNSIKNRCAKEGSKLAVIIAGCCSCFLWCLDKFLKFLSRNAYIEIAIYGYGFCPAAKRAFKIITSNLLRLAAINSIGDFVLFLGKITIVALTTLCGYYIFQVNLKEGETLQAEWGLVAMGACLSYFIAHCFMSIYEMIVDTIFICFCEDMKMNDGDRRPYFMSKGLMEFIKASKYEKY